MKKKKSNFSIDIFRYVGIDMMRKYAVSIAFSEMTFAWLHQ